MAQTCEAPRKVRRFMSAKLVALRPEDTVFAASKVFHENGISGAPVMDQEGRLQGIVTETDIMKAVRPFERRLHMVFPSLNLMSIRFEPSYQERDLAQALEELRSVTVAEVMTKEVYVVTPEDSVQMAVLIMNGMGVNRLPVLEEGKVVGIITRGDVIRYLAEEARCQERGEG
jgi:CBS domain-containing protein